MRRRDRRKRQRGVLHRLEMRDQMPTVKPAHRMSHKVDSAPRRFDLEEPVQPLCPRRDGAGPWYSRNDDVGADRLAEDVEDGRPVLHPQARWPTDVKAVQP